jgi:protein gp37
MSDKKLHGEKYWRDSWNPLTVKGGGYHCTKCSPGCQHCWAEAVNMRFGNGRPYDASPVKYRLDTEVLWRPRRWRKRRTLFVCDLCDLYHELVTRSQRAQIFEAMVCAYWHNYLVLTKRPASASLELPTSPLFTSSAFSAWYGVSLCHRDDAYSKVHWLLGTEVLNKWLSLEPLLGRLSLNVTDSKYGHWLACRGPRWVVVGAESIGSRPGRKCELEWVYRIVSQCQESNVRVFVKQLHIDGKLVKDITKFPPELQVRQLPFKE